MWCLTLAADAIVCWSTEYHGPAVGALRAGGHDLDDELLAHIRPGHHGNVHFYGTRCVEIDGETRPVRRRWLLAAVSLAWCVACRCAIRVSPGTGMLCGGVGPRSR